MKNKKEKLTIIAKITANCNLNCIYCYDRKFRNERKSDNPLPLEDLSKLLKMAGDYAETIDLILHGGEPTLAGLSYIRTLMEEIIPSIENCRFNVFIQTNGTLITSEWIDLFKEKGITVGVSYSALFEKQRYKGNEAQKVLENIMLLEEAGLKTGVLDVLTNESIESIDKISEFYKRRGIPHSLNIAYSTIEENNPFLIKGNEGYLKTVTDYFVKWVRDKDAAFDRFASLYIELLLTGQSQTCHYNGECLSENWFSINANKEIYPCDNDFPRSYLIGHIDEITSIKDIFKDSKYDTYIRERSEKLSYCKSNCNIYGYCKGGCPSNDIITKGNAKEIDTDRCSLLNTTLLAAYIAISDLNLEDANPILKSFIIANNSVLPSEINDLLRFINIPKEKLEYRFVPKLEGKDFEIFKTFNNPELEKRIIKSVYYMEDNFEKNTDRRFENILLALKDNLPN